MTVLYGVYTFVQVPPNFTTSHVAEEKLYHSKNFTEGPKGRVTELVRKVRESFRFCSF